MADEPNSWQEAMGSEDMLTLKHQYWLPIRILETQPKCLPVNPDTKDRLLLVSTASSTRLPTTPSPQVLSQLSFVSECPSNTG